MQKLENALELYNNQYERLLSETVLDEEEAEKILHNFTAILEKEDKKINKDQNFS